VAPLLPVLLPVGHLRHSLAPSSLWKVSSGQGEHGQPPVEAKEKVPAGHEAGERSKLHDD